VAWGRVSVTVPPEVGSRLKVAFCISEWRVERSRRNHWGSVLLGCRIGEVTLRVPTVAVELMDDMAVAEWQS